MRRQMGTKLHVQIGANCVEIVNQSPFICGYYLYNTWYHFLQIETFQSERLKHCEYF